MLAAGFASQVTAEPRSFLLPGGQLDFGKVLAEFADDRDITLLTA